MKILIACDSFKDALAAPAVCEAVARGLRSAVPDLEAVPFPLADGGEGTAELLTHHRGGEWISCEVTDPLGRPIRAGFGRSADGRTAFLDLAAASGLQHLREEERNPWLASTFGTGQLLQQALDIGVEEIVLGIGGSATHDAGLGMALALGYRLWAEDGAELAGQGRDLQRLHRIDASQVHPRLREVKIITLTDVNNPLVGPHGAARVYAPQKGADEAMVAALEQGTAHWARVVAEQLDVELAHHPGAGAAGGVGAGAIAFLGASLQPGAATLLSYAGFPEQLRTCQWVITGEGRLDGQTAHGKLIHAVARSAGEAGVPVIALCGSLSAEPAALAELGLRAAFSISEGPATLATALAQTEKQLERMGWQLGRLLTGG